MKVIVDSKKGLKTDLRVTVDKKTINDQMVGRFEELKKTVNLKGFRPGKVPIEILKRQFGKAVYGEVLDKVLKESSSKALEDKKIKVAGQPKIDLKSHGEDKDLQYTIHVEQLPKIKTKGIEKIKITNYEIKTTNIDIDKRIKDIAKNQIVLAKRHNQTKISLDIDGLTEKTLSELKNIQKEMFGAAKKILDERVVRVSEYQQFKKELENGKMIDCSWCGNQICEDKIKEETGADLRVIPSDNTKAETCIYCKNSGTTNVLFARGY